MLRQWDKAVAVQQNLVDQSPGDILREAQLIFFMCERDNSTQLFHDFVGRYPELAASNLVVFWNYRLQAAITARDWERAIREADHAPHEAGIFHVFTRAILYRLNGQETECSKLLEVELESLEGRTELSQSEAPFIRRAFAWALLAQPDRALEEVEHLKQELENQNDAMAAGSDLGAKYLMQIWSANPADAIPTMREKLKRPTFQFHTRFNMLAELWAYPLWDHPDYVALYEDDDAWAPFFRE